MSTQTVVYAVLASTVTAVLVVSFMSPPSKSSYETDLLRSEFEDLKYSIQKGGSPFSKPKAGVGARGVDDNLPPVLRMFGKAPENRPSTVKRTPKPGEGKWGGGPDQFYDGITDAKHLGGSTGQDKHGTVPGLWNFLLKGLNVRSVVDVGCGRGISTRWFMDHGADVLCLEGANDAIAKSYLPKDKIVAHDFSLGPYWPDKTYDMAWCIEVLEHIARPYMKNYQTIFHKSALILASHSAWGGHHHVEVHPDWWWVSRMEMAGFVYSPILTRLIRSVAAKLRKPGTSDGQHIVYTTHVYINPKVASLPEHAHLMGMLGCFSRWPNRDGKMRQQGPCPKEDDLPPEFLPVHRTPTQYDQFDLQWDFGDNVGGNANTLGGAGTTEFDLTLTNDPKAKCLEQTWPGPSYDDGCPFVGKMFDGNNMLTDEDKKKKT